ncbi:MAG: alpha/beta hydrolase [Rhodobacter sp.]|uniref:alpha/beta fold hydrolase n=1 Tax=Pararhodobacter sp. TaxID=2127056 RepID=UPI001DCE4703|nr:alpha/beta hydrolase [Pararhodobacter sp.]MCB1346023.1 alpha/beta hydrolase [Paracoccaceae bacterium]MCC0071879.1 alpha/beta hydrolase [Rhodobacter sp.]HPD91002.1 alpha/beta hydrolase [Pararhodobacter sp.]
MTIRLHRWGAGPPVIFLHGWTMTGAIWAPVAQRLDAASLAPDLPGHGGTRGPAPSVAGGVALLADLIAQEGIAGATLVGWSLGALIGWRYLAEGGTGVARMMSLDMSPRPLPAPGWNHAMRGQSAEKAARGGARFRADWAGAARAIAQGMFADPDGCAALSAAEAERRIRAQDPVAMAAFWDSLTREDLRAAIPELTVPVLAVHGAQSRVYPPTTAGWIAAAARHGQARVLQGCGHAPHLEDPAAVAALLTAFIADT